MEESTKATYQDRARGMLVGLAVGDALGAPVEFGFISDSIRELGDKIAHFMNSPHGDAGEWTDDTSMALCIADSLLEKRGYDSYDIMNKFYRWVKDGYRSHDGYPADDVGLQTRREIIKYHRNPIVYRDEDKTDSAGNGAIMRLAPIVIANFSPISLKSINTIQDLDFKSVVEIAMLSCRETHNSIAAECVTALFAIALQAALCGCSKSEIRGLIQRQDWNKGAEYKYFLLEHAHLLVDRALGDSLDLQDLGGYIVDAFAIALWGFTHTDNFRDGMLKVIQLGGDTDTNAAIYGQLAGAFYGYESIPEEWRGGVQLADELIEIADNLLAMDGCPIIRTRFEDDRYFQEKIS